MINGPARLFASKKIPITDPQAVDGEIFTVNRAGFGYLATTLKKRLPQIQSSEIGDLVVVEAPCKLRFQPKEISPQVVKMGPEDSVFEFEEKFSTLAYVVFRANPSLFSEFHDLFSRKMEMAVKVPGSFIPFVIDIDRDTKLPKQVSLFFGQKLIGDYRFYDTSIN